MTGIHAGTGRPAATAIHTLLTLLRKTARMRRLGPLLLILVAACDSPSPALRDGQRHEYQLEGYRFTIWRKDAAIEVIRHGYAPRTDQTRLKDMMAEAATRATGCALVPQSIEGDTGVLRARLSCPAAS